MDCLIKSGNDEYFSLRRRSDQSFPIQRTEGGFPVG
jgi:hypothetical protein